MTITVNLTAETAQRLREKAEQRGQTLEIYLESLAREAAGPTPAVLSAEEWVARFRAWAESHQPLPVIADDSRESIYKGRGE
jgi:hypothetical protein